MINFRYPLRRCRLPLASEIMPYLEEIDANQWYSNFGPLSVEFEKRLAVRFGLEEGQVQLVSSATIGLYLALSALNLPKGSFCAVPSLTFPATVSAVRLAGLTPIFIEIDPETLTISTEAVLQAADACEISSAVPVSFFGIPIAAANWQEALNDSGIKAVFDAAWCFDDLETSAIPSIVSLHATKVLGIGEGGFVTCLDREVIQTIRRNSNFGMTMERDIVSFGVNGKMSEYSAAVGLAALDGWEDRRSNLSALQEAYVGHLSRVNGLRVIPENSAQRLSGSICVMFDQPPNQKLMESLQERSIEARYWWTAPCHTLSAFSQVARSDLCITNDIASRVINLPFYEGLSADDVEYIVSVLSEALSSS